MSAEPAEPGVSAAGSAAKTPLLFAVTLFLSAALLFCVQPLIAKMILPLLGGAPAVWNTCMVFFQALLLAGYSYAHASIAWLGARRQAMLHLGLLVLPALTLPLLTLPFRIAHGEPLPLDLPGLSELANPPTEANPIPWLLLLLLVSVGLPFLVLSTSAPVLQKWFAGTGHPAARDPYFLYAASNLGSMLALLGYPILLEPFLGLVQLSHFWTIGYGAFVLLTLACAVQLWRAPADLQKGIHRPEEATGLVLSSSSRPVTAGRRLCWVALAFVPSSLMLGVTTYLTTDVAAIPLLWVLPLALYLLTFILVFARQPPLSHRGLVWLMPLVVVLLVFLLMLPQQLQLLFLPLHLVGFFVIALVCHGELARDRPAPAHLTEFYLWLSVGGVLGGLFNGLLAPLVFDRIAEYPLALVLACLLRPSRVDNGAEMPGAPVTTAPGGRFLTADRWADLVLPLVVGAVTLGVAFAWKPKRVDAILLCFLPGLLLG
jgi:hypothetical protein